MLSVPVVLDTDIGDDIDDTWALAMLLGCPEVDLRLVVTTFENTPERTRLTARILDACGRDDIPLATGRKTGDRVLRQRAWLGDWQPSGYAGGIEPDGIGATARALRGLEQGCTLLCIGPLTNIAEIVRVHPDVLPRVDLVCMAGNIHRLDSQPEVVAEWNVMCDIPAAQTVFGAHWKSITLAPLDTCADVRLDGDDFARMCSAPHARAKTVIANHRQWEPNESDMRSDESSILYDTVAACLCFEDRYWEMEEIPLAVTDTGHTVRDAGGRPVRCALRWRDLPGFKEFVVHRLTRDPF